MDRELPIVGGGNDLWNGRNGFTAVVPILAVAVVQQNDRSSRETSSDVGSDPLGRATLPVIAGDGPLHGSEAEIARGFEICGGAHAAWRPRPPWPHAGRRGDDLLRSLELATR